MTYSTITIAFHRSASPQFPFALKEARLNLTFREDRGIYLVDYSREQFDDLHKLLGLIKGFRNRHVFIDKEERMWDEVFHYLWCYTLRQKAYDPAEYCSGDARQYPAYNPWYCIQARMPFSRDAEWLHYGHFDSDGTWIFDKDKIAHYLRTNAHEFRFCPAYNLDHMLRVLKAFPETVNPKIDKDWVYSDPIDKSLCVSFEVSFHAIQKAHCYSGVVPASHESIKNILKKIYSKLQNIA